MSNEEKRIQDLEQELKSEKDKNADLQSEIDDLKFLVDDLKGKTPDAQFLDLEKRVKHIEDSFGITQ